MKVKMKNETNPLERRTWRSDSPARLFQWFFRIFSSDPASISDGYFTASLLSVPRISPCQVKTPFYPFSIEFEVVQIFSYVFHGIVKQLGGGVSKNHVVLVDFPTVFK